jgi:hypothetical protein
MLQLVRVLPMGLSPQMVPVSRDEAMGVVSCWFLVVFPDSGPTGFNPRNSVLKVQFVSFTLCLLSS